MRATRLLLRSELLCVAYTIGPNYTSGHCQTAKIRVRTSYLFTLIHNNKINYFTSSSGFDSGDNCIYSSSILLKSHKSVLAR